MSTELTFRGFLRNLLGTTPPMPEAALAGPDRVVTPNASLCVQCGVCGFNCPVGIPVRDLAHQGQIVDDPRCVQCGQCVEVCPRGTLRWAPNPQPRRQWLQELDVQLLADEIVVGQGTWLPPGKDR